MGLFSWLTSDDEKSMVHVASGRPQVTHYLLQPGDLPHIRSDLYFGNGIFGETDAYEWMARINAPELGLDLSGLDEQAMRDIGITLTMRDVFEHAETGQLYWVLVPKALEALGGTLLPGNFATHHPDLGGSVNELEMSGVLIPRLVPDIFPAPYQIKISKNPDAVYEDLPPAKRCPEQGYC